MKRLLVSLLAALLLAFPIAMAIAGSAWFRYWMEKGHGWDAFSTLLDAFGTIGVEGEGNVVVNTLLFIAFVSSFALTWLAFGVVRRLRRPKSV